MSGLPENAPSVTANVVAELIEQAPARVRKKLDRSPEQSLEWTWSLSANCWSIDTDGECVELQIDGGAVRSHNAVKCSCLLSPRCFHVIACLSLLPIADENESADSAATATADSPAEGESLEVESVGALTPTAVDQAQREAAEKTWAATASMLSGGARAAGAMPQAALLRAAHHCRLAGLYRLGNATIRLVASLRQCRSNADTFESDSLLDDLLELLHCSKQLQSDKPLDARWFGVARRRYTAQKFLKVHGLFCEPLVTRSGFAGVVSYFINDDGDIFSVSNVRPGDVSRIQSSYRGGLDVGGVSTSHRDASRSALLMQHGSVSDDGRIGGGQRAKGVVQSSAGWDEPAIQKRFAESIGDQITRVFGQLLLSDEQQRAGWDLLFLRGESLGGDGSSLALQTDTGMTISLGCASFSERLAFADNMQRLGERETRVVCIARLVPDELGVANLLAIAADETPSSDSAEQESVADGTWSLPETWNKRVNVGLDSIQGAYLPNHPSLGVGDLGAVVEDDGMDPLRRRMRAVALGGRHGRAGDKEAARDVTSLQRSMLPTAGELLDHLVLACSPSDVDHMGARFPTDPSPLANAYLAAAIYEQAARSKFLESNWLHALETEEA